MTVPHSLAATLSDHVRLELESIDRLYLNVYVPLLQCPRGIWSFFRFHCGQPFPSSELMGRRTRDFVANVERFASANDIPLVTFRKGQRKEDLAKEFLRDRGAWPGVLFIGKAQEKTRVFRTQQRVSSRDGNPYPWIVESTAMINHYYFCCVDEEFGPFFLKIGSYFPHTAKLCLNGHEYAKRQLQKEGIRPAKPGSRIIATSERRARWLE